jgi:UDP-N-acetylmuramoylalanine--D-glutamate ligase
LFAAPQGGVRRLRVVGRRLRAAGRQRMNHLRDITVLVLGLGTSGLAMARWCARHGAQVQVWDSREQPPQAAALKEAVPNATRVQGALMDATLNGVQLVLKSPGLSPLDAAVAPLLQAAAARGVLVQGELELFAQGLRDLTAITAAADAAAPHDEQVSDGASADDVEGHPTDASTQAVTPAPVTAAPQGYVPQVIAITGTNGKTTTTALTALLVQRAGRRVATAGNIGPSMLDTLTAACLDAADRSTWPQVWVLELSSFQLDGVRGFEPTAAAVLNVTQDHLDWHGSMDAYVAAKANVFGARTVMVINRGDAYAKGMADAAIAAVNAPKPTRKAADKASADKPKLAFGKSPRMPKLKPHPIVYFGVDGPAAAGDFGLVVEGGMTWLVRAMDDSAGGHRHDSDVLIQRLMPADAMRLRGRHNAANALAALALASAVGCNMAPMLHGLREYRGEPHRVQLISSVNDVEAFDDSKGTNVGATLAAIEGLGADRDPAKLLVILGGDGKGQDFTPLAVPLARHARAVALIGRDADLVQQAIDGQNLTVQKHATLEDATRWCFAQAQAGDAVLLSPACASLDMFRNYEHRAQVFVATVQAAAAERGEVMA